jgi:hypothetical protein
MHPIVDHPLLLFVVSFVGLSAAAFLGSRALRRRGGLDDAERADFDVILAATLTLLGLIIGFTFSMATTRYDQRKNLEEEEANAIGTEYLRADLLPADSAAKLRPLLREYVQQRVDFYTTTDADRMREIDARTARLHGALWSTLREPAIAQPTPITALAIAGMNDVLNSQGYTQAAWWNRIPTAAWWLMALIAACCNVMIGIRIRGRKGEATLLLILPAIVSIAFMLIADIDSPRGGVIRVAPHNLNALADSLR